jgi:hypothetical protein
MKAKSKVVSAKHDFRIVKSPIGNVKDIYKGEKYIGNFISDGNVIGIMYGHFIMMELPGGTSDEEVLQRVWEKMNEG